MPYPNEHAARIKDPGSFDRLRRKNNEFGQGVDVIYGVKDGKTDVQSIRFDKKKFSPDEARQWLSEHDYTAQEFEPASDQKVSKGDAPGPIRYSFEITKFDAEQRLVEGWATTEARDRQGDSVLFQAAVKAFEACASALGIREMHQPKAIGVLKNWWADETNKRIGIQIYLSTSRDGEDALTKVKEGVLRGFSIMGRALDWAYEGSVRIIKELTLTEISLVDVPANPQALITVVKLADGVNPIQHIPRTADGQPPVNVHAGREGDPIEIGEPASFAPPQPGPGVDNVDRRIAATVNKLLQDYQSQVDKIISQKIAKAFLEAEQGRQIRDLTARGLKVGIVRKTNAPLIPPPGCPTTPDVYADPANWSWLCDTGQSVQKSLGQFNVGAGLGIYTAREWSVLGRRIARMASAITGKIFTYSPSVHKVLLKESNMSDAVDLSKASLGDLLSQVQSQLAAALQALGDNPEASSMLNQASAALSVASDVAGQSPSSTPDTSAGVSDIGNVSAAVVPPSSAGSGKAPSTPSTPSTPTKPPEAAPSSPSSSPSSSSFQAGIDTSTLASCMKAMADATNALNATLATLKAQPVAKGGGFQPAGGPPPVGDIPPVKIPVEDPAITALRAGDLAEAIKKAGGDINELYRRTDRLVKSELVNMGITAQRFQMPAESNPVR